MPSKAKVGSTLAEPKWIILGIIESGPRTRDYSA